MTKIQSSGLEIAKALQDPILANEVGNHLSKAAFELLEERQEPEEPDYQEVLAGIPELEILDYLHEISFPQLLEFLSNDLLAFEEEPDVWLIPWLVKNLKANPEALKLLLAELDKEVELV